MSLLLSKLAVSTSVNQALEEINEKLSKHILAGQANDGHSNSRQEAVSNLETNAVSLLR